MAVEVLEFYFDFFYAEEILANLQMTIRINCQGCQSGALSQLDHTCLTLTKSQHLELYFDDILRLVDELNVLFKWNNAISKLSNISSEQVDMFKLKVYCRDWRDTDMKTDAWKLRMRKMVSQLSSLNRRIFGAVENTLEA